MALFAIFFPWTRKGRGRKFFFPSFAASISPSYFSKNLKTIHTPSWPSTMMKEAEGTSPAGGCIEAALATLPLRHDWTWVG